MWYSLRSIVLVQILTVAWWIAIVIGNSSSSSDSNINNNLDIDIISADDILNPSYMPTSWLIWDDDYGQIQGQTTESLMMRSDDIGMDPKFDAETPMNGSFGKALNTMGFHR